MTEGKEFHIGTVLSVLTGRLLAPGGMGDIYLICEHMSGETGLMTHQLPRVMDEIKPHLTKQLPELAKVEIPSENMGTWDEIFGWMDVNLYDKFGEMIEVFPIPSEDHTVIDPISELKMKAPHMKIIAIDENGNVGEV